jgi:hypothetical protein
MKEDFLFKIAGKCRTKCGHAGKYDDFAQAQGEIVISRVLSRPLSLPVPMEQRMVSE